MYARTYLIVKTCLYFGASPFIYDFYVILHKTNTKNVKYLTKLVSKCI